MRFRRYLSLLLCVLTVLPLAGLGFTSCGSDALGELASLAVELLDETDEKTTEQLDSSDDCAGDETQTPAIDESGTYDDKESVALYLHTYGKLPPNYITKKDAQELGWEGGSVEKYAPGKCIGGSVFGNYEGLLPDADRRVYRECDIGTLGEDSRGAKRIVYSSDGLIYYTEDHYETFELLYGGEG